MKDGQNLPEFQSAQLAFADHIRNPEVHARPSDIEARRMQIYVNLFFNNVKGFISSAFPVTKSLFAEPDWLALVREFFHKHHSQSPYFLEVSEEFLAFLQQREGDDLPDFLLELCHYEWVELALDVADPEPPQAQALDPQAEDLQKLVLNPAMMVLSYAYPVHQIGPDFQPRTPPAEPTHLVVYRTAKLRVRFFESNAVTHRLLGLLAEHSFTGAVEILHDELSQVGRDLSLSQLQQQARGIVVRLEAAGIILGTAAQ